MTPEEAQRLIIEQLRTAQDVSEFAQSLRRRIQAVENVANVHLIQLGLPDEIKAAALEHAEQALAEISSATVAKEGKLIEMTRTLTEKVMTPKLLEKLHTDQQGLLRLFTQFTEGKFARIVDIGEIEISFALVKPGFQVGIVDGLRVNQDTQVEITPGENSWTVSSLNNQIQPMSLHFVTRPTELGEAAILVTLT